MLFDLIVLLLELAERSAMASRNGAKRITKQTSAHGTTWASWMDDRTTSAYAPDAQRYAPGSLRAAPRATTSARSDEAELMWLDSNELMTLVESAPPAAGGGSIITKCLLPASGLFAAVLFGHVILAGSVQSAAAVRGGSAAAVQGARSGPA